MRNKKNLVILGLISTAIILGAVITQPINPPYPFLEREKTSEIPDNPNLTDKERALFLAVLPGGKSTSDEIGGFVRTVAAQAVPVSEITFADCAKPSTVVAKVKEGGSIIFRNPSEEGIELIFTGKRIALDSKGVITLGPLSTGSKISPSQKTMAFSCPGKGPSGYVYVSF